MQVNSTMGAFVHFEDEVCDLHNHQALAIATGQLCPVLLAECAAAEEAAGPSRVRFTLRVHTVQGLS